MNDDPGHEAAEEVLQRELDNHYEELQQQMISSSDDDWVYCSACYVRRDHVYDLEIKAWRCGFCGIVNDALTRLRKVVTEIAEKHLERNPEEE